MSSPVDPEKFPDCPSCGEPWLRGTNLAGPLPLRVLPAPLRAALGVPRSAAPTRRSPACPTPPTWPARTAGVDAAADRGSSLQTTVAPSSRRTPQRRPGGPPGPARSRPSPGSAIGGSSGATSRRRGRRPRPGPGLSSSSTVSPMGPVVGVHDGVETSSVTTTSSWDEASGRARHHRLQGAAGVCGGLRRVGASSACISRGPPPPGASARPRRSARGGRRGSPGRSRRRARAAASASRRRRRTRRRCCLPRPCARSTSERTTSWSVRLSGRSRMNSPSIFR